MDRVGAETDTGLQRDRHRLVGPRQFLDGHAQPGEVTTAPVWRRERDAEQPELPHRQHDVDGERVVAIPLLGVRLDLGGDELAHHLAQRFVFLGQLRMHLTSPRAPAGLAAGGVSGLPAKVPT